mmetsp:Transcript_10160/g.9103  ORF Transcript_10160/g.9103 Transcript_10160/m.9103 type:complete len:102 (+) Transcript_10160:23-328(+)
MVRVWFPSMFMRLISVQSAKRPPEAILRVPPSMTKFEIKEYLTKIYNIPVIKVNTMNYQGKWKRILGKRRIISYRRRNYKKAVVTFENTDIKNYKAVNYND